MVRGVSHYSDNFPDRNKKSTNFKNQRRLSLRLVPRLYDDG